MQLFPKTRSKLIKFDQTGSGSGACPFQFGFSLFKSREINELGSKFVFPLRHNWILFKPRDMSPSGPWDPHIASSWNLTFIYVNINVQIWGLDHL